MYFHKKERVIVNHDKFEKPTLSYGSGERANVRISAFRIHTGYFSAF